jgi:transposase
MKQVTYVGLDVHKNSITAVFGPALTQPESMKVKNEPKGWDSLARRLEAFEVRSVFEASSCGFELYDEMTARRWHVIVVAPTLMPRSVKKNKVKTDLKDAVELRSHLVAHWEAGASLPSVWIPPEIVRQDRELVRRRLAIGGRLTRAKSSIKNLLQNHKVRPDREFKTPWSLEYRGWLTDLCGEESALAGQVKTALASMMRELEFLVGEGKVLDKALKRLAEEARHKAQVEAVREVVGVGQLTALTFLTELGDVTRFENRKQVGSYLGLTPTSYESGEADDRKGHITRMGPPRIRKVLNQAAWCGVHRDAQRGARFAKVSERTGSKKAIVGEMRKLGIELWHRAMAAQPA